MYFFTLQKANTNHTGCVSNGGGGDGGDGGNGEHCGSLEYEKDGKCETDKVAIAGIVCGVIGGVLVVAVVAGVLIYMYKKKKKEKSQGYSPSV